MKPIDGVGRTTRCCPTPTHTSAINYDDEETQFVISWRTKKTWANTCRKLIVTLNDGSTHTVYFEFVK